MDSDSTSARKRVLIDVFPSKRLAKAARTKLRLFHDDELQIVTKADGHYLYQRIRVKGGGA